MTQAYLPEKYRPYPDLDLNILPEFHTTGREPQIHSHEFYEMVLIRSGTALHYMNQETIRLQPGELLLILPGQMHEYRESHNLSICNILFGESIRQLFANDLSALPAYQMLFQIQPRLEAGLRSRGGFLCLEPEPFRIALDFLRKIRSELQNQHKGGKTMVLGLFLSFMSHCMRHAALQNTHGSDLHTGVISLLLADMEQHPEKKRTLTAMATAAGMSLSNFRLCFTAITGKTPGRYLLELRVSKAADLLRNTALPISAIAFRTGFQDANYFTRQFHQIRGSTPGTFRKTLCR